MKILQIISLFFYFFNFLQDPDITLSVQDIISDQAFVNQKSRILKMDLKEYQGTKTRRSSSSESRFQIFRDQISFEGNKAEIKNILNPTQSLIKDQNFDRSIGEMNRLLYGKLLIAQSNEVETNSLILKNGEESTTEPQKKFSKEEVTVIKEDLNLQENKVIKNKKVVLDMVTIQTNQKGFVIISEEFVSNNSIIQNFPEGKTASEKSRGRGGGYIFIITQKAKGRLSLLVNGENGGVVPPFVPSAKQKAKLVGRNGKNGIDAVYNFSYVEKFIGLYPPGPRLTLDIQGVYSCASPPTEGTDGEDGRVGFKGSSGKSGGRSGSFHIQSFDLSDFHLGEIKNIPGKGSRGGMGSIGGPGGRPGRNGRDPRRICKAKLRTPQAGRHGKRGSFGRPGIGGEKGTVCIEHLKKDEKSSNKYRSVICY